MWLPAVTLAGPEIGPVTLSDARDSLHIEEDDESFDRQLELYIAASLQQIETLTMTRLITQTVLLQAGCFSDLGRLPIGPIQSITSIVYLDTSGVVRTLDPSLYELFGARLRWGIRPIYNGFFPPFRAVADAVRVTAEVGYGDDADAVPQNVRHAMMIMIRAMMDGEDVDVKAFLINHGIWL